MISIGFPNGCEQLDNGLLERFRTATHEDNVRDAIASYTMALTLGGLFIDRVHHSYYTNDGCIYVDENKGAQLIGLNESKFGSFAGSIAGSKINFQFAQAVAYALKLDSIPSYKNFGHCEDVKFFWLTSEKEFHLILVKENLELINALTKFYINCDKVTPCKVYQLHGISEVFESHPLNIHRSFSINDYDEEFKFSEFIKCTLESVNIPVTMFNGNNN